MELNFRLGDIDQAAQAFLPYIGQHRVIAFHGEMGAGKTTFIHALCAAMGVQDTVSSPTFSIINQYQNAEGISIYHMDLYRIRDEAEAIQAGVEDALYSGNICLVEWPEKAAGIFPDNSLTVRLYTTGTESRKLEINL